MADNGLWFNEQTSQVGWLHTNGTFHVGPWCGGLYCAPCCVPATAGEDFASTLADFDSPPDLTGIGEAG